MGGTLRQRAERLFLTRDTPLAELDRRHFVKGAAPAALLSPEERARQHAAALEAALLEAKVNAACPGQSPQSSLLYMDISLVCNSHRQLIMMPMWVL